MPKYLKSYVMLFASLLVLLGTNLFAQAQRMVPETFMIPGADPGIQLFLVNKHLEGQNNFSAERVFLFVHGAPYPSEAVVDLDLPGGSMIAVSA